MISLYFQIVFNRAPFNGFLTKKNVRTFVGLTLTSVLLILLASLKFFFSFIGRGGVKGLPFETAQCACAPARENGRALTPTMFQKK